MGKSKRGAKGAGFDYDGRRSQRATMMRGAHVKPLTHRHERRGEIRLIQRELEALEEDRAAERHEAYNRAFAEDYGDVFLSDQLCDIDDMIEGRMPIDPAFAEAIDRRLQERAAIRKWELEFRQSPDDLSPSDIYAGMYPYEDLR